MRTAIPTRTQKGSPSQALSSYKRTYLGFLRAIHQTQLVSAVAEHSLHNFPKGLPPSAARAVKHLFHQISSAISVAVSDADPKKIDSAFDEELHKTAPTRAKRMQTHSDKEAAEIAMHALHLMLAQDLQKKTSLPRVGKQFQALARHQAVAMLYGHLDAFFGDTLRVICRARPEVLRSGKQLTWELALSFESIADLAETLAEQFIYEFGWKTLADRLKFIRDKFGVDIASDAGQLKQLTLFEQRRHLIIHNGGIVTAKYITDTGDSRAKVGRQISISRDEVGSLGHSVMMLGSELCSAVAIQFLGAKDADLTQVWKKDKRDHKPHVGKKA